MILWFADRFGLPGKYHRIWVGAVANAGINPSEMQVMSLHGLIPRTLLTRLGSRKAPTWIPEEGENITAMILSQVQRTKPRAVVLTSPESLAVLGVHPEHATLHNLRGSVYWRYGIPFIVTLPISAWNSMVTQKDIGASNYGFESQESFAEGRSGTLHEGAGADPAATGVASSGGNKLATGRAFAGQAGEATRAARHTSGIGTQGPELGHVVLSDSRGADANRRTIDLAIDGSQSEQYVGINGGVPLSSGAIRSADGDLGDEAEEFDSDGVQFLHEGTGDDAEVGSDEAGEDGSGDSVDDVRDNNASSVDDDEAQDEFFYEPVLSPVGRFVITADLMKLGRILKDGRNANGPAQPIILKW